MGKGEHMGEEQGSPRGPEGSQGTHTLASMWYTMRQKLESEPLYLLPG